MQVPIMRIMLSIVSTATAIFAADFWQSKPFSEWTEKEAARLLVSSPWARQVTVSTGPGDAPSHGNNRHGSTMEDNPTAMRPPAAQPTADGAAGIPRASSTGDDAAQSGAASTKLVIQWRSARPVKQALARLKFGAETASSSEARQFIEQAEPNYVVAILGIPRAMIAASDAGKSSLLDHTTLTAGGQTIHPADIQFRPGPTLDVFLVFPHFEHLSAGDKEIELSIREAPLVLKEKFRLKDMLFNGRLEL